MATIDIQLSQGVLDRLSLPVPSVFIDGIERVTYAVAGQYTASSSWSQDGSTLLVKYADGSTETYADFVRDKAGASQGSATAGSYVFQMPDGLTVNYAGKLNLDYTINGNSIVLNPALKGFALTGAGFATQLAPTDPSYDPVNGNATMAVKGELNLAYDGSLTGTLSQLTATSEKFLLSETIDGNFKVTGNLVSDGEQRTNSVVAGTLTGFQQTYADGSHINVSGASAALAAPYIVDAHMLADPANWSGDDTINIDLPAGLASEYLMASGAGDDQVTLKGGGHWLDVDAGDGNDRITLLDEGHRVEGGQGRDTVILQGARADYQAAKAGDGTITITDKAGITDTLTGIERIQFSDMTIAEDLDGNAGQTYRLYQAAFARTPDDAGLAYWIYVMDHGAGLGSVAQAFVASDEFRQIYGANPSNHDLVVKFYENILHRAPEQAGLDYWVGVLDNKLADVAGVLASMSESGENKAGLVGVIGNGFAFTPYHP